MEGRSSLKCLPFTSLTIHKKRLRKFSWGVFSRHLILQMEIRILWHLYLFYDSLYESAHRLLGDLLESGIFQVCK